MVVKLEFWYRIWGEESVTCDATEIRARIDRLHDRREAELAAAAASPGPVGSDLRELIAGINEQIDELERAYDICVTADEDRGPVDRGFVINHVSARFRGFGIDVISVFALDGDIGFWFSDSRRHVRIHDWPPVGSTIIGSNEFTLQISGSMRRQQSGTFENGQMRIPAHIHVHSTGHPYLASANVDLRTEPPGVLDFWRSVPTVWAEGHPVRMVDGRPQVRLVGRGEFSSGFLFGSPLLIMLDGHFPDGI